MIRSLLFFIFICIFTITNAQFEPQFSQNMFNQLSVNPGYTGRPGKVGLVALNRSQLDGMNGAPKTMVFGADAGLKFMGFEHGIGLSVMNNSIGSFANSRASFSYALKIDLAEGQLSTGVNVGVIFSTLKGEELKTDAIVETYGTKGAATSSYHHEVVIANADESAMDLGAGVYYSSKKIYAGFSALHLSSPTVELKVGSEVWGFYCGRTWFFTGGYIYDFVDKPFEIEPSIFIKSDESAFQVDFNTIFKYKKRFWGGLTYRLQDAIVVLAGIELKNGVKVGCSYDFAISHLAGVNTFEVALSYWFSLGISKQSKQFRSVRYL